MYFLDVDCGGEHWASSAHAKDKKPDPMLSFQKIGNANDDKQNKRIMWSLWHLDHAVQAGEPLNMC
jgi:hypothetical protein